MRLMWLLIGVLLVSNIPVGASQVGLVSDCLQVAGKVKDGVVQASGKCDKLLKLMSDCEKKGADLSSIKGNVELSKRYLDESVPVYEWSINTVQDILNTLNKYKDDKELVVDVLDGDNGILMARFSLYYALRDLNDLNRMLDEAINACNDFLNGRMDKGEFEGKIKGILTSEAGVIGLSASLRETAYNVAKMVNSAWVRLKSHERKLEKARTVERVGRFRLNLATLGAVVGLALAGLSVLQPTLLGTLGTFLSILAQVVTLAVQLASLIPLPT
ncbi:hypothetical protein [Methanopyrus kandleri]|uniref:hypothetical protein n=1 Tax=Methanopyrus kandleri TaxID=2320 RepID=UPI0011E5016C|nr:hypothetical protein [Methanopyrus kandleri]